MSADLIERLRATYTAWNNPPSDGLPEGAGVLIEAAVALAAKDTALSEMRAELERVKRELADIELDIHLAEGMSRGYDLKPALAKIRSLLASQDDGEER